MKRRPPNIIICLCDQLRAFEVGCYGHPVVRTPQMDGMAEGGVRFETACSNSPLCVPARNILLSGQYARTCTGTASNFVGFPPSRQRVVLPDPVLPEILRKKGYQTALIGKWHVHPSPDLVGFQHALYPHNLHQHYGQAFYDLEGKRTVVGGFSLDYEIEQVRQYIRQHKNNPFFLYYNISPPHMPLSDAPSRYTRMYRREDVILRENVWKDGKLAHDRDWFRLYMWDYLGHLALHLKDSEIFMTDDYITRKREGPWHGVKPLLRKIQSLMEDPEVGERLRCEFPYLDDKAIPGDFDLRDLTALYYGMVSCVDDYLGKLLRIVREENIEEDTILVFTSDHGENLGSHHLWMKDHLYEESIRIPMIFNAPGVLPAGETINKQVISLVDVAPTLLSLAGLGVPNHMQGADLSGILKAERETTGSNLAFIETFRHRAIGVRSPYHLYGIPMEGTTEAEWQPVAAQNQHLFFNLQTDPFELRNMCGSTDQSDTADILRSGLLDWHGRTSRLKIKYRPEMQKAVYIY